MVARTRVVSWLRGGRFLPSQPYRPVGLLETPCEFPLQWRGRAGITPASVSPDRDQWSFEMSVTQPTAAAQPAQARTSSPRLSQM